jgi:5-methylcytosine-specific restriction protein A
MRGRSEMANAPSRPCSVPACPNPGLYRGRCTQHARKHEQERGSASARGYDRTWQRLRRMKLAADPFCEIRTHCKGLIPDNVATEVDHIIPIAERPDLRLVWSNLQSSCTPCHSAKTMRESSQGRTAQ